MPGTDQHTAPHFENTYADALPQLCAPARASNFPGPQIVLLNESLADQLGLDQTWLRAHGAGLLSATVTVASSRPVAQAYAGHQFGHFNPRLGDGRAMLLGELVSPAGRRSDLHLKGSGVTIFSRGGDGRAALDSALREYVMGEAMHALRIPTTRALSVVRTGEVIARKRPLPGAVLGRVAASHIRIGTLEYCASRKDRDTLQALIRYTLRRHYPDLDGEENPALALLGAVYAAQARLVARWMSVGFIHGVMNTDNVSLAGETIDYGPCAFMDTYDPATVFSEIDSQGRYAYGNQPRVAVWNMARLAEAVLDELDEESSRAIALAEQVLSRFQTLLLDEWLAAFRPKIGLDVDATLAEDDRRLLADLLALLSSHRLDFTRFFRELSTAHRTGRAALDDPEFHAWSKRWLDRLGDRPAEQVADAMDKTNPIYVPRNHRLQAALDAAVEGDLAPTLALLEVVTRPFEHRAGHEADEAPGAADGPRFFTHCNT